MFEIFGLLIMRAYGYGWLWGKRISENESKDHFGDGSLLFMIGFLGMIIVMAAIMLQQPIIFLIFMVLGGIFAMFMRSMAISYERENYPDVEEKPKVVYVILDPLTGLPSPVDRKLLSNTQKKLSYDPQKLIGPLSEDNKG